MKTKLFSLLLAPSLMLVLQGCAHSPIDDQLDKKLANEPAAETRAQLSVEAGQQIAADKELTPEQKSKLAAIGKQTRAKTDALREESVKLKMVLVKDLLASNYDSTEVDLIKKRIRDNEQAKLSEYFKAIRETNILLGRWASRNQRIWTGYDTDFYNQIMMPTL